MKCAFQEFPWCEIFTTLSFWTGFAVKFLQNSVGASDTGKHQNMLYKSDLNSLALFCFNLSIVHLKRPTTKLYETQVIRD